MNVDTDLKKLKVEDIKQRLINEGRFTAEEIANLNIKGKTAWANLYFYNTTEVKTPPSEESDIHGQLKNELDEATDNLNEIEIEIEIPDTEIVQNQETAIPEYTSPEWHDFVMSQFTPDELLQGKYPKVDGLRRVAEKLLGNIIFSGPIENEFTMHDTEGKAVSTYRVVIEWTVDAHYNVNLNRHDDRDIFPTREFRAIASAWKENVVKTKKNVFQKFFESIAETRAEGRALRKALLLKVVCADELMMSNYGKDEEEFEMNVTDGQWEGGALITEQQVQTIKLLCQRLEIDEVKFINSGKNKYNDINEVTRETAAEMIRQLNKYQSSESVDIPLDIVK
jgi:hypothetical protein